MMLKRIYGQHLTQCLQKEVELVQDQLIILHIYVFGGEDITKTYNNNEKYNIKDNKWESKEPLPTARHGLSAVSVNDKIYVIGGGPEPGLSVTNVNEIFNTRE